MSGDAELLTIEKNDVFRTRPSKTEQATKLREEWQRAVAGSLVKAIKAALGNEGKSGEQVSFLIESFIEQLDLNSEKLAPELREVFSDPIKLSRLSVGNVIYPFREVAVAAFVSEYKVLVLGALQSADLRGYGDKSEAAQHDLALRLHTNYQRLSRLLPSELTEDDSFELEVITNLIDVRRHEELTPANRRKIGIVTCRYPFRITWWGDEDELEIDLSTSPCQLAAFDVGDWFDASVEFDRKHRQVLRILTAQRLPPRAEKPYDDNKLAREMMELKKISPDDI